MERFDLAVVGAGIVGLGHAAAAAERGLRVVVVDRAERVAGATVRNFGHVGTGMQSGMARELAERTRELWLRHAERAGFWLRRSGTLVVARHADELAVLEEAVREHLLSAGEVSERAPVRGALGGALLPQDLQVDPREAGPALAAHLAASGIDFRWRTAALGIEPGVLQTSRGALMAEAVVVAVNHDVDHLFPAIAEEHDVVRCSLDMLLADGIGLELPVLTGSSLLRYGAFAGTAAAPAVRARLEREQPELLALDVNQMYTERPDGTLIVGDTHDRGVTVSPFQPERAFQLLEDITAALFLTGRPRIRERWQGIYASAPEPFLVASPADGVRVVSVTTGIGMTTGLGLAESVVEELFGSGAR